MPEPTCAKCGRDDVLIAWHGAGAGHYTRRFAVCRDYGRDWGKPAGEHLHYTCRTCQYDWTGPLTPAEATEGCACERREKLIQEAFRDA